jgi:hypothetical protein
MGVGVLPLAPFVALVCSLELRASLALRHDNPLTKPLLGGIAAGLALMSALDVQGAAMRLGIEWAASADTLQRQRGLSLLRTFGDDEWLLRLCYGAAGRPTGLLSAFILFGDNIFEPQGRWIAASPAEAREIYYRVHGVPFNAKPAPSDNGRPSPFDNDLGGTEVGGRLTGLHMVSSRLDGSISGDDAVAYLEWTVEFGNSALLDREVRLELALPPRLVSAALTVALLQAQGLVIDRQGIFLVWRDEMIQFDAPFPRHPWRRRHHGLRGDPRRGRRELARCLGLVLERDVRREPGAAV